MSNEKKNAADSEILSKQQMNVINGGRWMEITLPDGSITYIWV